MRTNIKFCSDQFWKHQHILLRKKKKLSVLAPPFHCEKKKKKFTGIQDHNEQKILFHRTGKDIQLFVLLGRIITFNPKI